MFVITTLLSEEVGGLNGVEKFVFRKGLKEFFVGLLGGDGDLGGDFGDLLINLNDESLSTGAKLNCEGLLTCCDLGANSLAFTGSTSGKTSWDFNSSLLSHFLKRLESFLPNFSFIDALRNMLLLL